MRILVTMTLAALLAVSGSALAAGGGGSTSSGGGSSTTSPATLKCKQGNLEIGITYYRKALAINPDFVLAREYLGEGYVAAGRVDLAKLELSEIQKRCGTACEEYKDLSKAISTAIN